MIIPGDASAANPGTTLWKSLPWPVVSYLMDTIASSVSLPAGFPITHLLWPHHHPIPASGPLLSLFPCLGCSSSRCPHGQFPEIHQVFLKCFLRKAFPGPPKQKLRSLPISHAPKISYFCFTFLLWRLLFSDILDNLLIYLVYFMPLLENKLPGCFSWLFLQCLQYCLTYSKHSIFVAWITNEWESQENTLDENWHIQVTLPLWP